MAGKHHERKGYVFLHERAEKWEFRLYASVWLIIIGSALFCAAYSTLGFWGGLWDILKHAQ